MYSVFSNKIVTYMADKKVIEEEDKELYEYAVYCSIIKWIPCILILILAICIDNIIGGITIVATFVWIRKYAGGYHASTPMRCLFLSLAVMGTIIYLSKILVMNLPIMIMEIFLISIMLYLAPIDSENKPLTDKQKQQCKLRLRILLFGLCCIEVVTYVYGIPKVASDVFLGMAVATFSLVVKGIKHK